MAEETHEERRAGEGEARQDAHRAIAEARAALERAAGSLLRWAAERGRAEAERLGRAGRLRLELRQLRRDRDELFRKLGAEARALVEGGEIDHPGLRRGIGRIEEVEARIARLEAELAGLDQGGDGGLAGSDDGG